MKKTSMFKKSIIIGTAVTLLTLAACSPNDANRDNAADAAPTPTPAVTAAPGETGTATETPPVGTATETNVVRTMEWLVEPRFDELNIPTEGLMPFRIGYLWGFINEYGEEIVPPRYTDVMHFQNGFASVMIGGTPTGHGRYFGGQWGVIDKTGTEVVTPQFGWISSFEDGIAFARTFNEPNEQGNFMGNRWGLIDTNGNEILPLIYDNINWFSDGLAAVQVDGIPTTWGSYDGGLWGFVDRQGNMVIEPRFTQVQAFSDGIAAVHMYGTWDTYRVFGGVWTLIDTSGDVIIDKVFSQILPFYNGVAAVFNEWQQISEDRFGPQWGLIDQTGREILPIAFDQIITGPGNFAIVSHSGKSGIADVSTGTITVPMIYSGINALAHGMAIVYDFYDLGEWVEGDLHSSNGTTWGLIDAATGREILPLEFDHIIILRENLVVARSGAVMGEWTLMGGSWTFFDRNGNPLTRAFDQFTMSGGDGWGGMTQWETASHGFIPVMVDGIANEWGSFDEGLWGFINDVTGEEIITPQFSEVRPFFHDMAHVRVGGALNEHHLMVGGYWGIVDPTGNIIVEPRWDSIRTLSDEMIAVMTDGVANEVGWLSDGRWGIIDRHGNVIVEPVFEQINVYAYGLIAVSENGKWGLARIS